MITRIRGLSISTPRACAHRVAVFVAVLEAVGDLVAVIDPVGVRECVVACEPVLDGDPVGVTCCDSAADDGVAVPVAAAVSDSAADGDAVGDGATVFVAVAVTAAVRDAVRDLVMERVGVRDDVIDGDGDADCEWLQCGLYAGGEGTGRSKGDSRGGMHRRGLAANIIAQPTAAYLADALDDDVLVCEPLCVEDALAVTVGTAVVDTLGGGVLEPLFERAAEREGVGSDVCDDDGDALPDDVSDGAIVTDAVFVADRVACAVRVVDGVFDDDRVTVGVTVLGGVVDGEGDDVPDVDGVRVVDGVGVGVGVAVGVG